MRTLTAPIAVVVTFIACAPALRTEPSPTPTSSTESAASNGQERAFPRPDIRSHEPLYVGSAEDSGVRGSLSAEHIRTVVRGRMAEVRACYEAALSAGLDREGRVQMRFLIEPDGSVGDALVQQSELDAPELESCILELVRTFVFEPPEGGGYVIVNYPFLLVMEEPEQGAAP